MLGAKFLIVDTCVGLVYSRKLHQFECYAGSLLAVALGYPVYELYYKDCDTYGYGYHFLDSYMAHT